MKSSQLGAYHLYSFPDQHISFNCLHKFGRHIGQEELFNNEGRKFVLGFSSIDSNTINFRKEVFTFSASMSKSVQWWFRFDTFGGAIDKIFIFLNYAPHPPQSQTVWRNLRGNPFIFASLGYTVNILIRRKSVLATITSYNSEFWGSSLFTYFSHQRKKKESLLRTNTLIIQYLYTDQTLISSSSLKIPT